MEGGQSWSDASLEDPVLPQSHTRFHFPWVWDGSEAVLVSRATDETGYVQPTREELVTLRRTTSRYLNNSQQNWRIAAGSGAITNYYNAQAHASVGGAGNASDAGQGTRRVPQLVAPVPWQVGGASTMGNFAPYANAQ